VTPIDPGALDWLLPSQAMNPSAWTVVLWCAPVLVGMLIVAGYHRWKNH